MSKQLYEEALADARSLREVAEDNAKRALIEAVTPRIRDLIERELLKETFEGEEDFFELDDSESPAIPAPGSVVQGPKGSDLLTDNQEPEGQKDFVFSLDDLGGLSVTTTPVAPQASYPRSPPPSAGTIPGFESLVGPTPQPQTFPPMLGDQGCEHAENELSAIDDGFETLVLNKESLIRSKKFIPRINKLISRVENTYDHVQETIKNPEKKTLYENKLESYYKLLNKLQEQKNMRNSRRSVGRNSRFIFEADDDLDLDLGGDDEGGDEEEGGDDLDLGGDDEGEDSGGGSGDLVIKFSGLQGISPSAFKDAQVSIEHAGGSDEGDDMDMDMDMGDDEELDLDLGGDDEGDDEDEELQTAGKMYGESRRLRNNVIVEIDEGMLRREVSRLKVLREARERNKRIVESRRRRALLESRRRRALAEEKKGKGSWRAPSNKGAGPGKTPKDHRDLGDPIVDIDLNELSEALRLESGRRRARTGAVHNGASSRSARVAESKLRNKLAETNLFNAKLVYSNKLLQNESLSRKQKAQIIERLDEAKTLREAKLVYESLVKAMAGTSRPLREGAERGVLGSSSRATRPASTTLNEGVETERWARLAGIIK
jgi:hypothetical protein